jgi:lysozyme family protein
MPVYQNQNNQQSNNGSSSSSTMDQEIDEYQELYGNSAMQDMANEQAADRHPPTLSSPYAEVYEQHVLKSSTLDVGLTESQQRDMEVFIGNWEQNRSRYETVASQTNIPAPLIAAIHWREASGNFNTYMHQGDPLGKPAVNWPSNIPIFHRWEDAATHALNMKRSIQNQVELTEETTNIAAISTYSEVYNGLGYFYKDRNSPYVYSGTNQYSSGKYVSDGTYSPTTVDTQLGIIPLVGALDGFGPNRDLSPKAINDEFAWNRVINGQKMLRVGDNGLEVQALQQKLQQLGYAVTPDGSFGPQTTRAVSKFQEDFSEQGLSVDGIVGKKTANLIEQRARNTGSSSNPVIE